MTLIKDITDCSTLSVRGLDNQLIYQMNEIRPGLLERIDDLNVQLGSAVHPWMQAVAKEYLKAAIAHRGVRMIINSAFRTIAGQALLRSHCEKKRCNITAAAQPGESNHNNASAIDIEDPYGWRSALEAHGWKKLGDFDRMHYDCAVSGVKDIKSIQVLAFQQLWNRCHPEDKLSEDGDIGPTTRSKLYRSPAEGFAGFDKCPRILKLTQPLQTGEDVGALQLSLRAAGIEIKADKTFGPGTDKALKTFQQQHNLTPDGIAGQKTLSLLKP